MGPNRHAKRAEPVAQYFESNSAATIASLTIIGVLTCIYCAWPVWRAFFPLEIDLKEPWNAYHADAVMGAQPLYPEAGALIANNYPPLYYYLVGLLSGHLVDATYVGRTLSIMVVGCIAVNIGLCIHRLNGRLDSAALGGIWFLGTMARFADYYVGMNDPNLFALAIMTTALAWYLHREPARNAEPVMLLMVIAGFFKHTLVSIPLTVLCLIARKSRWFALRAALFGASAAIMGIILCTIIHGTAFIDQLFFFPREISLLRAARSLERLGGLVPAFLVWAMWAWPDRRTEAARFTAIFIGLSFIGYLVQKSGEGVDVNAQFELTVAMAIGIGLAYGRVGSLWLTKRLGIEGSRLAIGGILTIGLVYAPGLEPYLLLASSKYRALFPQHVDVMRAEVARVAGIPGQVSCTILSVCRAAGKPFVYDAFAVGQRVAVGRLSQNELQAMMIDQGIRIEAIDPRASAESLYRHWSLGRSRIVQGAGLSGP